MLRLLRLAIQLVLFFLLLSLVVAVGSAQTGPVEKAALITAGVALVWLASRVRRIDAPPGASRVARAERRDARRSASA